MVLNIYIKNISVVTGRIQIQWKNYRIRTTKNHWLRILTTFKKESKCIALELVKNGVFKPFDPCFQ